MSYDYDEEALASVSSDPFRTALAAFAILLGAIALRSALLNAPAEFDEYYQLLAARGWLETGRPTILDGEYTRAIGFTGVVAWLFSVTDSASMATGRLVALTAGALIPPLLFLWLKLRIGWVAGLIGAGLALFWPQGIWEAQMLRFYSWHSLLFMIGAIAVFEAVARQGLPRALLGGLAVLAFYFAFHLQVTTMIGVAGILLWIGVVLILPAMWRHPRRWLLLGSLAGATLVITILLWMSGTLAGLWEFYRWTPGWNAHLQDKVTYYSNHLRRTYSVLWPLFPVAALLAYWRYPRMTLFCSLVFLFILLAQSFGGMKATRYLSYGMPFFFSVYGLAAAAIWPAASDAVLRGAEALNPTKFRWVAKGLAILALAFAVVVNPFFSDTLKGAAGRAIAPSGDFPSDWSRLPDILGDWQNAPFRLILMDELQPIAMLGDYDVLFSPTRMDELPEQFDFSIDPRTGRPVIEELETVAAILRCQPEGLLVTPSPPFWGPDQEEEWLPLFEAAGRTVETRRQHKIFALYWHGGSSDAAACASLPQ